jgi:hypothetical protein
VILYFDGGLFHGKSKELSGTLVTVIFSSRKQTADALLKRALRDLKNPQEYALVTSDRAIVTVARRRRVPVIASDTFAVQLIRDLIQRQSPEAEPEPPSPKEDPNLSDAEVKEWMEAFGPVQERPRRPYRRKQSKKKEKEKEAPAPEPPAPPRAADELKDSGASLTEAEIAQWLALFGDAEPADEAKPAPKPRGSRSVRRRKDRATPRPADKLKKSGASLNEDEVDAWLDIFREGKNEEK